MLNTELIMQLASDAAENALAITEDDFIPTMEDALDFTRQMQYDDASERSDEVDRLWDLMHHGTEEWIVFSAHYLHNVDRYRIANGGNIR
jgi:hypothetical protein